MKGKMFFGYLAICLLAIAIGWYLYAQWKDQNLGMQLVSSAFKNNDEYPEMYACGGTSRTPPFTILNAPEETKSFAFATYRPAFLPKDPILWMVYDVPGNQMHTPDSLLKGTMGKNLGGKTDFIKPCTKDKEVKFVTVAYALDIEKAPEGPPMSYAEFQIFIAEHALDSASIAFYLRNP